MSLLGASGAVVAATTTNLGGGFDFAGLAAGTYRVAFGALRPGESFQPGDPTDVRSGVTAPVSLAAGQSFSLAAEHVLLTPVALTALANATVSRGDGNYTVTAPGSLNRAGVQLGNGTQSVTLTGWADRVVNRAGIPGDRMV